MAARSTRRAPRPQTQAVRHGGEAAHELGVPSRSAASGRSRHAGRGWPPRTAGRRFLPPAPAVAAGSASATSSASSRTLSITSAASAPVEAVAAARREIFSARARAGRPGDAVEGTRVAGGRIPGRPLLCLDRRPTAPRPGRVAQGRARLEGGAVRLEHMRVAPDQLVADRPGHVVEREGASSSAIRAWNTTWSRRSPSSSRRSSRSPRATASATS